ncbi:MFS family permease [Arthrobacter oryzae]|nr:MFS family permease [Arthrobacter oryzae]
MRDSTLPAAHPATGIFRPPYLWVTIGTCALVFLAAFESLAVTTIMPLVSRELNGGSLYALAFAGPLATGVIGMVGAGNWSDRRGPAMPLYASVSLFVLGLLIAGSSVSMPMLVAGRLVQGLGGGALTVALYVLVARFFPARSIPGSSLPFRPRGWSLHWWGPSPRAWWHRCSAGIGCSWAWWAWSFPRW